MKLSQSGQVYYVTGHVTDHIIIRFIALQLPFYFDTGSDKCIALKIIALVWRKPPNSSEKLKQKLYMLIDRNVDIDK